MYLKQPVAASMERRENSGVNIAAVDALNALNLQLHVIFTGRLAITTFLPAVAILTIASFLTIIQQHHARCRPDDK